MAAPTTRGAVLVSGASTGIGRETALRLARAGHPVFAGVRKQSDADSLRGEGVAGLTPVLFDVTDAPAIAATAKTVAEAVGEAGLQGVVANAGIGVGGPLEFIDLDEVRHQLEVNVIGVLAVVQAAMPLIRKGKGRVVITGSIAGRGALPILGPYAASKFALEAIAESMRRELAPSGIHVALIEPGAIETPMMMEKAPATGQQALERLEGEAKRLYEPMGQAVNAAFAKFATQAIPPDRVAKAIEHALTARRPKTRYLVGPDARVQAFMAWALPDRMRDAVFGRLIGLPRG